MAARKIVLRSSDDHFFEIDEEVALQSQTIKHLIEDTSADNAIPVSNVRSNTLSKVIDYCKNHVDRPDESLSEVELKSRDACFVDVDEDTLYDLIMAAHFLSIKSLLDLTCLSVVERIKGKTPDEIRMMFNINNDFTLEEKEEIKRENHWLFG